MLRLYGKALHRVDAGWLNAFGWSNIGIERYFDEYFARTADLNRIVASAASARTRSSSCSRPCNERAKPGEIAAIELNASLPQRQLPVRDDPRGEPPAGRPEEPPPGDPQGQPRRGLPLAGAPRRASTAARRSPRSTPSRGCASTRRPASRTSEPLRRDLGAGDQADRAAGRRRSCARPGIRLPIIANGGIRDFDDCREYVWAGADAVSLGSAVWLQPMPLYALGPLEGLRIRRLISRMERYVPPGDGAPLAPGHGPGGGSRRAAGARLRRVVSAALPRVAIVTTGGTIDSVGVDRLDLAAYLETGVRLAPGELVAGIAPELAMVARATEVPFRRLRAHALTDARPRRPRRSRPRPARPRRGRRRRRHPRHEHPRGDRLAPPPRRRGRPAGRRRPARCDPRPRCRATGRSTS